MQIELVYEKTCPNIKAAREQLLHAFAETGIAPHWQEWEVSSPQAPSHVHGYGSPTILVNGRDVSGEMAEGDDYCCRVYYGADNSNKGVPALTDIVQTIHSAFPTSTKQNQSSRWRLNSAMLPTVGIAFLPKLACPSCWPAYAGLLSSLGIGFFDYTPYLLPFTALFVLIAIAALAYRAEQHRGYKPLLLGLLAGAILLPGKFYYDSDVAMYAGLFLLVIASLWNTWPWSNNTTEPCTACMTESQQQHI